MVKNYPVEINLPVHVIFNLNLFPDFFSIHIIDKLYAFSISIQTSEQMHRIIHVYLQNILNDNNCSLFVWRNYFANYPWLVG